MIHEGGVRLDIADAPFRDNLSDVLRERFERVVRPRNSCRRNDRWPEEGRARPR
jgi:hypothetical protein